MSLPLLPSRLYLAPQVGSVSFEEKCTSPAESILISFDCESLMAVIETLRRRCFS